MYILGINGGFRLGYQDVAAVLLKDGQIVAAVEEERLTRIKFSAGKLSEYSIDEVMKLGGITIHDVAYVACHGSTWGSQFPGAVEEYFKFRFGYCPPIALVHHHDAHAASSYYASGFDEAMILTVDGSGDGVSTQLSCGKAGEIKLLERYERPNSLGMFYSMITQYCGFTKESDEYKLMGLASYGRRGAVDLSWLLHVEPGFYSLNTDYPVKIKAGEPQPSRQQPLLNDKFYEMLKSPRLKGQPITKHHEDVAAAAQAWLEEALISLVADLHKRTGYRKLCLAGGVALNCVANQKLAALDFVDEIYVQPASNDAGIALGAAYMASVGAGVKPKPMESVYLGRAYSNEEIEQELKLLGAAYETLDDPAKKAADLVAAGNVIGWFQSRAEFGPRALGSRSILADPRKAEMKDIINAKIKFREAYRPFCPSVLEGESYKYFKGKPRTAPHMTITFNVTDNGAQELPAITHTDGTARIQTVHETHHPLFHQYLKEMKNITGHGVGVNTSFNRNGEPMVYKPQDALATFAGSGLDALVIGNYLIRKKR